MNTQSKDADPFSPSPWILRFFTLVLVGLLWWSAWLALPMGSSRWMLHNPALGRAEQTPLAIAIQSTMKPYIPLSTERYQIIQWIQSGGSRTVFYGRIWPIIQNRCHRCHGSFRRPTGAPRLVRFAHFQPLIRMKASLQKRVWNALQKQLPSLAILCFLLAWLIGTTSFSKREKSLWICAPCIVLCVHLCSLALGIYWTWGLLVSAYTPWLWASLATVLAFRMLHSGWKIEPPEKA